MGTPSVEEFISCSREELLEWDPVLEELLPVNLCFYRKIKKALNLIKKIIDTRKSPKAWVLSEPSSSGK